MPEYFFILMGVLAAAVILHTAYKVRIYTSITHCIAVNLAALLVITIWDNFAIYRGHWSFGERFLIGPKIGFIPIEEYMLILIFPYFGLVVYKILEKYLKRK